MAEAQDLADQLWGARNSVKLRWPGLSDEDINTQIDNCYEQTLRVRPWFDSHGQPALYGAATNKRVIKKAQERYAKRIMTHGLRMEERGTPQGMIPDGKPECTALLSGKQLAMAAYKCFKENPEDPRVQEIRLKGCPVLIRPSQLPVDVQTHIVERSNMFHDGQGVTLAEILGKVPDIQADFLNSKGKATARSQPGGSGWRIEDRVLQTWQG